MLSYFNSKIPFFLPFIGKLIRVFVFCLSNNMCKIHTKVYILIFDIEIYVYFESIILCNIHKHINFAKYT